MGYQAYDKFCFVNNNDNFCFQKHLLEFVGAYEATGFRESQGLIGLAPNSFKGANEVSPFLNQIFREDRSTLFSILYSLDTRVQSKVMFGVAPVYLYGPAGSTYDDLKWAKVSNTTDEEGEQWLATVMSAGVAGVHKPIFDTAKTTVVATIDSGTSSLLIDHVSFKNYIAQLTSLGLQPFKLPGTESYNINCKKQDCSDFPDF